MRQEMEHWNMQELQRLSSKEELKRERKIKLRVPDFKRILYFHRTVI